MSWGTCYKSGTNNLHFSQPPMMNDSRLVTSWKSIEADNKNLMQENGITNSFEYRQFLTQNGQSIRTTNNICAQTYVGVSNFNNDVPFQNRYLFKSNADVSQPYGYEGSNMKHEYISREALNRNMSTPFLTQEQMLNMSRSN